MSVCDGCPVLKRVGTVPENPCPFDLWDLYEMVDGGEWHSDPPDICKIVSILRLLAEATDIDDLKVEQHIPQSYGDPVSDKWSVVKFWIRR